ncbi:uncharacterized protein N7459_009430 [Penicillium hispanicum]|uniref:uncharacterized protein n=1 Tax=Penicillium hispanicum TaxID=1080232 RepID=UPI002541A4E3|nr:uncharacterized protein N7459_009430 [Penicillium hispanicum]KAJ5570000.1 hypothetical protein N7459_009430 [Penicillium hispanicum]
MLADSPCHAEKEWAMRLKCDARGLKGRQESPTESLQCIANAQHQSRSQHALSSYPELFFDNMQQCLESGCGAIFPSSESQARFPQSLTRNEGGGIYTLVDLTRRCQSCFDALYFRKYICISYRWDMVEPRRTEGQPSRMEDTMHPWEASINPEDGRASFRARFSTYHGVIRRFIEAARLSYLDRLNGSPEGLKWENEFATYAGAAEVYCFLNREDMSSRMRMHPMRMRGRGLYVMSKYCRQERLAARLGGAKVVFVTPMGERVEADEDPDMVEYLANEEPESKGCWDDNLLLLESMIRSDAVHYGVSLMEAARWFVEEYEPMQMKLEVSWRYVEDEGLWWWVPNREEEM